MADGVSANRIARWSQYPASVEGEDAAPTVACLQVLPNPTSGGSTSVVFRLPHAAYTQVEVSSVSGRRVRRLVNEARPAGPHVVTWDHRTDGGQDVPGGVYFVRMAVRGQRAVSKVTVLR